jgi:hypothetical protein
MNYRPNQMAPGGDAAAEKNEPLLVDEMTRVTLETIADAEGRVVSRLLETILRVANMAQNDQSIDQNIPEDLSGENPADEWEQVTNEIMQLENIRNTAIALAEKQADQNARTAEQLQQLAEVHDKKIRKCERKLDELMARYTRRSAVSVMSVDY